MGKKHKKEKLTKRQKRNRKIAAEAQRQLLTDPKVMTHAERQFYKAS